MINTRYSKPSSDILKENLKWESCADFKLKEQKKFSKKIKDFKERKFCTICSATLCLAQKYNHRGVIYIFCENCGHMQTQNQIPIGYPNIDKMNGFEKIYPRLGEEEYRSRTNRIYKPKLDWALEILSKIGLTESEALEKRWLEMGCGAGNFLSLLVERGASNISGIDTNIQLISQANEKCRRIVAKECCSVEEEILESDADIIVSFFVMEHLQNAGKVWKALEKKKKGTILIFAVPTFGISTLLESSTINTPARNLDNVVHTQLYTDRSIDYVMKSAGYTVVAEWLFGQDAQDLIGFLLNAHKPGTDSKIPEGINNKVKMLIDRLQTTIDEARMCDARHIIAVKD